ncbi:DUF3025 domain-containing protein [Pseudoalteromonas sp. MMG013]|uniref:DUF3025 domain-containing protein n=1 Tax=Pseudoalteromonas sp. MMG013 TaxID=2822687 RepID=UPI001B360C02|nr:DUF3025 domain-containing protein [Pseudoalteromonas sp. MMG013]MBQ4863565.1 DUF3025 domain-containing protein [Pseudoalteromonas sp. MMG013]
MKKFTPSEHYEPQLLRGGAFAHLNTLFGLGNQSGWPDFPWLNGLAYLKNSNGQQVSFVPDSQFQEETRYYEQIIYETGHIPTREQNWHDLFGALIWCLFPKTKSLLNKSHIDDIDQYGLKQRSKHRNALTLFDECGVVMAITDEQIKTDLRAHNWHSVFVSKRTQWGKAIQPFIFGHANYEMLTQPFIGLTGKVLCIVVETSFSTLTLQQQYAYLDDILYTRIAYEGILKDNSQMSPLPLLGIPGWCEENEDAKFYDNTDYFRAKRR